MCMACQYYPPGGMTGEGLRPENLSSTPAKLVIVDSFPYGVPHSYLQVFEYAVYLEFKDLSLSFADEILHLRTVVPKLCCTLALPGDVYHILMPGSSP